MGDEQGKNLVERFGPARSVGDYELTLPVSLDGLGETWAGYVSAGAEHGRAVLVTIVDPTLGPASKNRIRRAAQEALRLRHPQVLATLDDVAEDGALYIIGEYLDGAPLGALLAQTAADSAPLSQGVALKIIRDAAVTLDRLGRGRGGNDPLKPGGLSPESIFVASFGDSLLRHPGVLAEASNQIAFQTHPSVLPYRAPEQVRGEEVCPASDVFAAGVMLWEMLAGCRLFGGKSLTQLGLRRVLSGPERAQTTQAILNRALPRLNDLPRAGGLLHRDVVSLVERCLSRKTQDRIQDLGELVAEINHLPLGVVGNSSDVASAVERLVGASVLERKRLLSIQNSVNSLSGRPPSDRVTAYPDSEATTGVVVPSSGRKPQPLPPMPSVPRDLLPPGQGPSAHGVPPKPQSAAKPQSPAKPQVPPPPQLPNEARVGSQLLVDSSEVVSRKTSSFPPHFTSDETTTARGPERRAELVLPPPETKISLVPTPDQPTEIDAITTIAAPVVTTVPGFGHKRAKASFTWLAAALSLASLFVGGGFAYAKGVIPIPFLDQFFAPENEADTTATQVELPPKEAPRGFQTKGTGTDPREAEGPPAEDADPGDNGTDSKADSNSAAPSAASPSPKNGVGKPKKVPQVSSPNNTGTPGRPSAYRPSGI